MIDPAHEGKVLLVIRKAAGRDIVVRRRTRRRRVGLREQCHQCPADRGRIVGRRNLIVQKGNSVPVCGCRLRWIVELLPGSRCADAAHKIRAKSGEISLALGRSWRNSVDRGNRCDRQLGLDSLVSHHEIGAVVRVVHMRNRSRPVDYKSRLAGLVVGSRSCARSCILQRNALRGICIHVGVLENVIYCAVILIGAGAQYGVFNGGAVSNLRIEQGVLHLDFLHCLH